MDQQPITSNTFNKGFSLLMYNRPKMYLSTWATLNVWIPYIKIIQQMAFILKKILHNCLSKTFHKKLDLKWKMWTFLVKFSSPKLVWTTLMDTLPVWTAEEMTSYIQLKYLGTIWLKDCRNGSDKLSLT